MALAALEPRIYAILRAPGVDLNSISTKRIRKIIADESPELEMFIKTSKKDIDALIIKAFLAVQAEQPQSNAKSPTKTDRTPEKAEQDASDSEDMPNTSQPVPLKTAAPKAKKATLTADEELARKLHEQINGGRTTRNGGSSSRRRTSKASSSQKGRSNYKSSAYIVDSDDELDGTSDRVSSSGQSRRKRKTNGGSDDDDSESPDSDDADFGKKRKKRKKGSDDEEYTKPKRSGGFNKPHLLSEALQAVTGETQLSRPQVVKKLWEYIRANELQNPNNRNEILCDDQLVAVFGVSKVTSFSMNKYIGKNLYPIQS